MGDIKRLVLICKGDTLKQIRLCKGVENILCEDVKVLPEKVRLWLESELPVSGHRVTILIAQLNEKCRGLLPMPLVTGFIFFHATHDEDESRLFLRLQ